MASVPSRHGKSSRNRPFVVDGRKYAVSVSPASVDEQGNVALRVTIRAEFGTRSFCLVRGLTNHYYYDYYSFYPEPMETISVTPQVICKLIELAHKEGWDPAGSKSNFNLPVDRDTIRALGSGAPANLGGPAGTDG